MTKLRDVLQENARRVTDGVGLCGLGPTRVDLGISDYSPSAAVSLCVGSSGVLWMLRGEAKAKRVWGISTSRKLLHRKRELAQ